MFDVGFSELLLLAIIGLLVLGPERLPRVARTLGGLSRKARSSWMNLKRSIDAEINAEEIKKPLKKVQDDMRSAMDGVDKHLKDVSDRVSSTVSATVGQAETSATTPPKPSATPSGTASPTQSAAVSAESAEAKAAGNVPN
ncbi:MAG TPA: Sec-independent protein translocase protein TatB [Xanthomonadales bacterium]|nr:Sec-independent protein translocase protein TatB [Xanthomonadales bacterium]